MATTKKEFWDTYGEYTINRWIDEKIEELQAKAQEDRSTNSSISKRDLVDLKIILEDSLKGIAFRDYGTSYFFVTEKSSFERIIEVIKNTLGKINHDLDSYNTPIKTSTAFAWMDPDSPKTVWFAHNQMMHIDLPVFSSKEKCKEFCEEKGRTFLEPVEIVVDGVNEFGFWITKGENDEQK